MERILLGQRMGGKQQKEEKEMIEELKERIYGWDHEGKPAVAGPPPLEEVIEKVNEIIRYLNATQRK